MSTNHEEYASYVPAFIRRWLVANPVRPSDCRVDALEGVLLFADVSGFTPLSQRLAKLGPEGAEELDRVLNLLYGRLVDTIHAHGGDVAAYAGDAAIAIWPADPDGRRDAIVRAAQAAIELQSLLDRNEISTGETLSLTVCLAYGNYFAAYIGGHNENWLPFVAGPVWQQICEASEIVKPGEIVISPAARRLVGDDLKGTATSDEHLILTSLQRSLPSTRLQFPPVDDGALSLLRTFVPAAIQTRLDADQATWLADLRHLTVVFLSFQGIEMNESGDVRRMHEAIRRVQGILQKCEGTLVQTLQDDKGIIALLCFGLPPFIHEDDADRAISAAKLIRESLSDLGIETKAGIATGRVFSGPRGNRQRREYAITGDLVNLAARLMALKNVDIVCDAATQRALRSTPCDALKPVKLKGITEPVAIFRPTGAKAVADETTAISGRTDELRALTEWLEAAQQQKRCLIIEGDPGVGKSVLVGELRRQASERELQLLQAGGHFIERDSPYYVWRDLLAQLLEFTPAMSADEKRERVLDALRFDASLASKAAVLNDILDLDLPPGAAVERMTGRARFDNLQDLVVQLLRQHANDHETLILLEDAHWLDASSWRLLATVMRSNEYISSVLSCRSLAEPLPDDYVQLRNQTWTMRLPLAAMNQQDLNELVRDHLKLTALSPQLEELLWRRSEGNPLFALKLIEYLNDRNMLEVADGGAGLSPDWNRGFEVPDSVRALVTARLDHLPLPEQMTLKVSSVIGQKFAANTLKSVHPQQQYIAEVPQHLDRMCEENLIESEQQPQDAFSFKHATIQEVTYDQIPRKNRRAVHHAIAEWFESEIGATATNQQLLAFHWGRANVPDREIHYLTQAGESAIQRYANREAANAFAVAIERHEQTHPHPTTDQVRQQAHWRRQLGEALFRLGNLHESAEQLEHSLALMGEPCRRGSVGIISSVVWQVLVQCVHRALPSLFMSRQQVDPAEERRAGKYEASLSLYRLGQIQYLTINMPKGLYCALHALNLSEPYGSSTILARSYAAVSLVSGMLAIHSLARYYASLAERIGRDVHDPATLSHLLTTLSVYELGVGGWRRSNELLDEALNLALQVGHQIYLYEALSVAGVRASLLGEYESAAEYFRRVHEVAERTGNELYEAVARSGLGECAFRQGDLTVALRELEHAEQLLTRRDYRTEEMRVLGLMTLAYQRHGDAERAREYADKTERCIEAGSFTTVSTLEAFSSVAEFYLECFHETPHDEQLKAAANRACNRLQRYAKLYPIGRPRYLLMLGKFRQTLGQFRAAAKLFRSSLRAAQQRSMPLEESLAAYQLGATNDDPVAKQEHLSNAIATFQRLGVAYELERALLATDKVGG